MKINFWSLSEAVKAPGTNDARSGMVSPRGAELMRKPPEAARVVLSYPDEAASAKGARQYVKTDGYFHRFADVMLAERISIGVGCGECCRGR